MQWSYNLLSSIHPLSPYFSFFLGPKFCISAATLPEYGGAEVGNPELVRPCVAGSLKPKLWITGAIISMKRGILAFRSAIEVPEKQTMDDRHMLVEVLCIDYKVIPPLNARQRRPWS